MYRAPIYSLESAVGCGVVSGGSVAGGTVSGGVVVGGFVSGGTVVGGVVSGGAVVACTVVSGGAVVGGTVVPAGTVVGKEVHAAVVPDGAAVWVVPALLPVVLSQDAAFLWIVKINSSVEVISIAPDRIKRISRFVVFILSF